MGKERKKTSKWDKFENRARKTSGVSSIAKEGSCSILGWLTRPICVKKKAIIRIRKFSDTQTAMKILSAWS